MLLEEPPARRRGHAQITIGRTDHSCRNALFRMQAKEECRKEEIFRKLRCNIDETQQQDTYVRRPFLIDTCILEGFSFSSIASSA